MSQEAITKQLAAALEPFALVAQHDVGEDEADSDRFRCPMSHNRAPLLTIADLRRAREAIAAYRAAQASSPQADADGWIAHDGGPCPVALNVLVLVKFRDEKISEAPRRAREWDSSKPASSNWHWAHPTSRKSGADIIAYRVRP